MQQNVVAVPEPNRPGEFRAGSTVVEKRKQGRFTWTVKVIRGGPPAVDRRQVLHQGGVKV